MKSFLLWGLAFVLFLGVPLASVIWFFHCLNGYNSAIPFTKEREKKKVRLITSGIIAGILVAIFLSVVFFYGFTEFF